MADQPDVAAGATRLEENTLRFSTATDPYPTRRYRSAEHATCTYLRWRARLLSCGALNYQQVALYATSDPSVGNPMAEQMQEVWELERMLKQVRDESDGENWRVWRALRVEGASCRDVDNISHTQARRIRDRVDGRIESRLVSQGKLYRNDVRDDDETREIAYDDSDV